MEEIKLFEHDTFKPELSEEFLEHHGILGMHWGVQNGPPYPLDSKVSTGKRLKSGAKGKVSKRKAKKVYKRRVKSLKKARLAREEVRKQEQQKQKSKDEIISTKDINAMLKNVDLFSNQEITDLMKRLDIEDQLKRKVSELNKANMPKSKKIMGEAKKALVEGVASGAKSTVKTVSKNAVKIGIEKALSELAPEEQEALIKKLFKEEKK